jgi:type III pantothenate kinase
MQSGVVLGFAGLVEGLVKRLKAELGSAKVIATGGLADIIAPVTEIIDVVDQQLTLKGLKIIYDLNAGE